MEALNARGSVMPDEIHNQQKIMEQIEEERRRIKQSQEDEALARQLMFEEQMRQ